MNVESRNVEDLISLIPEGQGTATLEGFYKLQAAQQERFAAAGFAPSLGITGAALDEHTTKLSMMGVEELVELNRAVGYKVHHAVEKTPGQEHEARLEWADTFKFLMAIAVYRGWTPDELLEAVRTKTIVAESYIRERVFLEKDGPWVAFDIDDVLADYTGYIADFIFTRHNLGAPKVFDNKKSIGEQMGLSRAAWEQTKAQLRGCGHYRNFPVIKDGVRALRQCRFLGYNILLITNRQMKEYPRLYSDTIEWLFANDIPYHALIFGSSKLHRLCAGRPELLARIKVAFDDHPSNIADYRAAGIPCKLVGGREAGSNAEVNLEDLDNWVAENLQSVHVTQ